MTNKPAILGGKPIFDELLPISRPSLPEFEKVILELQNTFNSGIITNGKYVAEFEERCAAYLGVENVIAVANATLGLMLILKALSLKGEVLIPSFTFTATSLSLKWNNLESVYVDCAPKSFTIDPIAVKKTIRGNSCAILAVCIFGHPPEIDSLSELAKDYRLKLIFDSAHGFGSKYKDRLIGGYGNAEVFSLSPTKTLTTGEGGLITTQDRELAHKIRLMRNYGIGSDYDCEFIGLNARMLEFSALLGLKNLQKIEEIISWRNKLAQTYREKLSTLLGIEFQEINQNNRSTYKDFAILIDEETFGLNRNELAIALEKENIQTRKYFYPPLHLQKAYRHFYPKYDKELVNTVKISNNILCLPIFGDMKKDDLEKVCEAIYNIQHYKDEIKNRLK